LARSEQHRQRMAVELENLRPAAMWVERGYSVVQKLRTVWPLVATVAGFFVARKGRSIFRNVGKFWSWWRVGKKLTSLWRRHSSGSVPATGRS